MYKTVAKYAFIEATKRLGKLFLQFYETLASNGGSFARAKRVLARYAGTGLDSITVTSELQVTMVYYSSRVLHRMICVLAD